ncbi:MAG: hypothetical protein IKH34_08525 [Oscillospiraceae bacterium]|nr:hypothetical protein [Oscillospiraceae bacterium]
MPSKITNYQCPACTGPLRYDGASGKLCCDFCGSSYTVKEIEALYKDKLDQAAQADVQQQAAQAAQAQQAEAAGEVSWSDDRIEEGMRAYNCPSCGAELICDETTAATSCPYCGNPTVVPGQFHGMLKPDYILPFKLDKEAAKKALREYYKGKRLLPKAFSAENHIEEIKGVYVPFWLFDGQGDADLRFKATKVTSHRSGDYQVTITDHYDVRRAGTVDFSRIPVDGSRKMPDAHMDAIEPFDYRELKPFSTAYMPGFLAERYDVDMEECSKRAKRRASNTTEQIVASTVRGYSSATPVGKNLVLRRGAVKYVMLPVWLLSTRWNGQSFLFAMNGQTGKLVGDLPVSMARYWGWFGAIAAPLAAILAGLLFLL